MATIRLQNVTRRFPVQQSVRNDHIGPNRGDEIELGNGTDEPQLALDGANLVVPDGQTIAVVGPSGCGKSTLLRVIAGLDTEYSGEVFYDEEEMSHTPPKDRYIGMVFQNYALYPHFMGHGNLSFFFKMRKIQDKEAEERIRITSEIMGIGFKELLHRKPGTLSGGQQQRVAIARAIVRNPKVFLFDEPLSNLDAQLRTQTRIEIKRLLRQFQITSLYVTHDQVEAITLGDQIVVMRAGKVEQVGSYRTLMDQPHNTFVAGFLGTPPMNLFAGVVAENAIQMEHFAVPLPPGLRTSAHNGQKLTVGIRPEAAQLLFEGQQPAAEGVHLAGVAEVVEPDFSRQTQLVYARTGDLSYASTGALSTPVYSGHPVEVLLPYDALYFFDEQGQRFEVEF